MNLFTVSESDVTKEWRRFEHPAFADGFLISRSYGGGRGREGVRNPTGWEEILQLLQEYASPDFVSSNVPHHDGPPSEADRDPGHSHVQDASHPLSSSQTPGDVGDKRTSKPTGSHTKPKRDKARRKCGTDNKHK